MIAALVLLLAIFAAPAVAQQADDQLDTPISVEDTAERDAAIAQRIRSILAELDGYGDAAVSVTAGIVTLSGTTTDQTHAAALSDLTRRVEGVVAIENEVSQSADVRDQLNPAAQRFAARFWQLVAFLPLAMIAFTAFALVVAIGLAVARLRRPWDRLAPNAFIAEIYRQIVRLAFIVAGLVIALDILNATALLSTILGAAGIVGLALGFAVRDTVENFIASIMLSIRQPFRPNDAVEIEGDVGKVIRLTSRATILLDFDGNHIRIPNATVFKSRIVNYTRNTERRFLIDLGVAYGTDLVAAKELALQTVTALPFVLDEPRPAVWIDTLGDSAVILRLAAWIAQNDTDILAARGEALRQCLATFGRAGIEMPGPTFTVVMAGGTGEEAAVQSTAPPASATVAPSETTEAQSVEAETEQNLERLIQAERAEKADEDLLSRAAPEE
jgi:small conductance mechanosensitive channel